jgi:hypothetical protein
MSRLTRSARALPVRRLAGASLASLGLLAGACMNRSADAPTAAPAAPLAARAAQGPTVTVTSPQFGNPGTTLDVRVLGSGFVAGAQATWLLRGVANPAKVRTNSTTYLSSTEVVANITISGDADLAFWDVQIMAAGKNGVGTESFEVTNKVNPPSATFYLSNDAAYLVRGDGAYLEGASSPFAGSSRYASGEACVSSVVYALPGGSGDATMNTGTTGRCARRVRLTYATIGANGATTIDGSLTTRSFLNVRKLHVTASETTAGLTIPVGGDALRTFALSDDGARCGTGGTQAILFGPDRNGVLTGADMLNVHRDAADQWTVSTLPDEVDPVTGRITHHDKAYCAGNGTLYHLPLRFTVRSSMPLSP